MVDIGEPAHIVDPNELKDIFHAHAILHKGFLAQLTHPGR